MHVSTLWMFTVTQVEVVAEFAPNLCGFGNPMFRVALAFPLFVLLLPLMTFVLPPPGGGDVFKNKLLGRTRARSSSGAWLH